jgi:hypothetical protein
VFGGGQFVVGGTDGSFLTSSDGLNWTAHPLGSQDFFLKAAYGNGRFVGVGSNDPLWVGGDAPTLNFVTSIDGLTWTENVFGVGNGLGAEGYFFSVVDGNGLFVAFEGNGGWFLTSDDGLKWAERKMTTRQSTPWPDVVLAYQPASCAYGDGHFVAVGRYGTILESGSIINLEIASKANTHGFTLTFEGPIALDYTLQSSSDLINWHDVTTITSTQSSKITLDGLPAGASRQFYRVIAP